MKTVTNLDFAPDMDNLFTSSTPLWEQMCEHRIYDIDETPIDIDKPMGHTVKPTPQENQFNTSEGEYWTPTEHVVTTEYIKNDVIHRLDVVTHKSKKVDTFLAMLNEVHMAKSPAKLGYLGYKAHTAIQASMNTFESDGVIVEAPTLFPSGYLKCFWKGYNMRKAILASLSSSEIAQIEALLAKELTVQELKTLKQGIYSAKLSYKQKKGYWDICDQKIATLSA